MQTGKIKTITDKGYGFIQRANEKDLFFHMKECVGTHFDDLNIGDNVEFDIGSSEKGPCANNVRLAE